jgi:hypothetical protein
MPHLTNQNRIGMVLFTLVILAGFVFSSCRSRGNEDSAATVTPNPPDDGGSIMPTELTLSPTTEPAASATPAIIPMDTATAVPMDAATYTPEPTDEVTAVPQTEKEINNSPIIGIGILGGSNSDEYRGSDNRGGEYASVTLGWVEQLHLNRELNFGEWGDWGEPRRKGFEYNWSRSGATTRDMIKFGQHTGLAEQIKAGKVSHALIFIGSNDFSLVNGEYLSIYDGSLDDAALQAKVDQINTDIATAVEALIAAGDVKLGIVSVLDPAVLPVVREALTDETGRERASAAIDAVNTHIVALAEAHDMVVIHMTDIYEGLIALVDADGYIDISGEKITLLTRGNEPHSGQLDDDVGHLGTVMSGYLANIVFVEPFNEAFGVGIRPLTEQEMLENAGIR